LRYLLRVSAPCFCDRERNDIYRLQLGFVLQKYRPFASAITRVFSSLRVALAGVCFVKPPPHLAARREAQAVGFCFSSAIYKANKAKKRDFRLPRVDCALAIPKFNKGLLCVFAIS
jgi:hypothetical protein